MRKITKSIISVITIVTTLAYLSPVYAISNKETIYSKLDASGKDYKTIVTTKGEETTQKEVEKELPLEAKITYKLDGKEIDVKDLAGKSGNVSIKIEYKNNSAKTVIINGKQETMYTPFVVALGTIIDGKNNTNIKVTSGGKIVENGDKIIVIGMVFPGLDESLNLNNNLLDVEIPSSLEITMDAKNFEMKNILTFATPKVFTEDINWNKFDDLFDKVNELKTSTEKIEDGANSLNEGMNQLSTGATTLNGGASDLNTGAKSLDAGIDTLKQGTSSLNNGASSLNKGAEDLKSGINSAQKGISNLKDGTSQVAAGASQVNKGANDLKDGIDLLKANAGELGTGMVTISNSVKQLNDGASDLNAGIKKLVAQLEGYAKESEKLQELIDVDEELIQKLNPQEDAYTIGILEKNVQTLKEQTKSLSSIAESKEIAALVEGADTLSKGLNSLNDGTKDLPTKSKQLAGGIESLAQGAEGLTDGTKALSNGASSLNDGADTLSRGANSLSQGASQLAQGTRDLSEGTKQVDSGVDKLSKGSKALTSGTKQLEEGTQSLSDGAEKLTDGSKELAEGIHKFNTEGINKIVNFVNIDIKNIMTRGKKLEELSNEYNKFSSDDEREDISFISMIDSIKSEEKNEDESSN